MLDDTHNLLCSIFSFVTHERFTHPVDCATECFSTWCAPIVVAIAFSIVRFAMLWGDTGLNVAKGDAVEVLDCPPDVSVASLTGCIVSDVPSVVQDLTELEVELPLAAAEDEEPEWLRKNKQYARQQGMLKRSITGFRNRFVSKVASPTRMPESPQGSEPSQTTRPGICSSCRRSPPAGDHPRHL